MEIILSSDDDFMDAPVLFKAEPNDPPSNNASLTKPVNPILRDSKSKIKPKRNKKETNIENKRRKNLKKEPTDPVLSKPRVFSKTVLKKEPEPCSLQNFIKSERIDHGSEIAASPTESSINNASFEKKSSSLSFEETKTSSVKNEPDISKEVSPVSKSIPCPICGDIFDDLTISSHASNCTGDNSNYSLSYNSDISTFIDSEFILCPICLKDIALLSLPSRENHVNQCINTPSLTPDDKMKIDDTKYASLSYCNFCPICNLTWGKILNAFTNVKFQDKLDHALKCSSFHKIDLAQLLTPEITGDFGHSLEIETNSSQPYYSIFQDDFSRKLESLPRNSDNCLSLSQDHDDFQPAELINMDASSIPYTKEEKFRENQEIRLAKIVSKVDSQEWAKQFKLKSGLNFSEILPPLEAHSAFLSIGLSKLRGKSRSIPEHTHSLQSIRVINLEPDSTADKYAIDWQCTEENKENSNWIQASTASPKTQVEIRAKALSLIIKGQ